MRGHSRASLGLSESSRERRGHGDRRDVPVFRRQLRERRESGLRHHRSVFTTRITRRRLRRNGSVATSASKIDRDGQQTYWASALLLCAANFETEQARCL